ncbi:MAG: hypothetical protein OXE76_03995 [Alphaproteobacteria bacterium]|nr:hypothetical protein [Alphaproteobacteria bacterium]
MARQTLTLPASWWSRGAFSRSWGRTIPNPSADGIEIDSALLPTGGSAFLTNVFVSTLNSITLVFQQTASGSVSRADLSSAWETGGSVAFTVGTTTWTFQTDGDDTADNYVLTPTNTADVEALFAAIASRTAATLVLDDGEDPLAVGAITSDNASPVQGETVTLTCPEPTGGAGDISYQWQALAAGVWQNLQGATSQTYGARRVTAGATQFRCVVTRGTDSVNTAAFTVTWAAATLTAGAVTADDTTPTTDDTATLTAGAPGGTATGTITYQWQVFDPGTSAWVDVAGETGATFGLTRATPGTTNARVVYARAGLTAPSQSIAIAFSAALTAPGPVGGLSDAQLAPTALTAFFDAPTTGGTPAFYEYRVAAGTAAFAGAWTRITARSFTATGLTADSPYRVQVRAGNTAGMSAPVEASFRTTPATAWSTALLASWHTYAAGAVNRWESPREDLTPPPPAFERRPLVPDVLTPSGQGTTYLSNFAFRLEGAADGSSAATVYRMLLHFEALRTGGAFTGSRSLADAFHSPATGWVGVELLNAQGTVTDTFLFDIQNDAENADSAEPYDWYMTAAKRAEFIAFRGAMSTAIGTQRGRLTLWDGTGTRPALFGAPPATPTLTVGAATVTDATPGANRQVTFLCPDPGGTAMGATTFQWQSFDGTNWNDIAGATAQTYQREEAGAAALTVRCVVTRQGLTANSGAVTATWSAPTVTVGAATVDDATPTVGDTVTFTCPMPAGTAEGAIGYQWQEFDGTNWSDIAGATSRTYARMEANAGAVTVRCAVTRQGVTANSGQVTATWAAAPPTLIAGTVTADDPTPEPGDTVTLTAGDPTGTATGAIAYQWQQFDGFRWLGITGRTRQTFTRTRAGAGSETYRVVYTREGVTAVSQAITVTWETAADRTPPRYVSAALNEAGTLLTLTFNEPLDTSHIPTGAELNMEDTLAGNVVTKGASGLTIVGAELRVTFGIAIRAGATLTGSYDQSATAADNRLRDAADNEAADFTFSVMRAAPPPPTLTIGAPTVDDATPLAGETVRFTAATPGGTASGAITYQWQLLSGSVWGDIAGETSATLDRTRAAAGAETVRVIVTRDGQTATSAGTTATWQARTLTAGAATVSDATPETGDTVTFTAPTPGGTAEGATTYQWQSFDGTNWTNIAGATAATLDRTLTAAGMLTLRVVLGRMGLMATSGGVTATWSDPPPPPPEGEGPALVRALLTVPGTLRLEFDEDLDDQSVPVAGDFTVVVDGMAARTVSSVDIADAVVTLGFDDPLPAYGATVRVVYVPGTNPLQNGDGDGVATFGASALPAIWGLVPFTLLLGANAAPLTIGPNVRVIDRERPYPAGPDPQPTPTVVLLSNITGGSALTGDWTVPDGVSSVDVQMAGAGGGGAGFSGSNSAHGTDGGDTTWDTGDAQRTAGGGQGGGDGGGRGAGGDGDTTDGDAGTATSNATGGGDSGAEGATGMSITDDFGGVRTFGAGGNDAVLNTSQGGGGGGYTAFTVAVTPGQVIAYSVGAGGARGVGLVPGQNGLGGGIRISYVVAPFRRYTGAADPAVTFQIRRRQSEAPFLQLNIADASGDADPDFVDAIKHGGAFFLELGGILPDTAGGEPTPGTRVPTAEALILSPDMTMLAEKPYRFDLPASWATAIAAGTGIIGITVDLAAVDIEIEDARGTSAVTGAVGALRIIEPDDVDLPESRGTSAVTGAVGAVEVVEPDDIAVVGRGTTAVAFDVGLTIDEPAPAPLEGRGTSAVSVPTPPDLQQVIRFAGRGTSAVTGAVGALAVLQTVSIPVGRGTSAVTGAVGALHIAAGVALFGRGTSALSQSRTNARWRLRIIEPAPARLAGRGTSALAGDATRLQVSATVRFAGRGASAVAGAVDELDITEPDDIDLSAGRGTSAVTGAALMLMIEEPDDIAVAGRGTSALTGAVTGLYIAPQVRVVGRGLSVVTAVPPRLAVIIGAAWPDGVPDAPLTRAYRESILPGWRRYPVEEGAPLLRRIHTRGIKTVDVSILMTDAEYAIFEAWYRENIEYGANLFALPLVTTDSGAATMRMLEAPTREWSGGNWVVSFPAQAIAAR